MRDGCLGTDGDEVFGVAQDGDAFDGGLRTLVEEDGADDIGG